MQVKINKLKCQKCGYTWVPRKDKVWVCPACHSYKWNEVATADDNHTKRIRND